MCLHIVSSGTALHLKWSRHRENLAQNGPSLGRLNLRPPASHVKLSTLSNRKLAAKDELAYSCQVRFAQNKLKLGCLSLFP